MLTWERAQGREKGGTGWGREMCGCGMKAVAGDLCLKESVQNCLAAAGRGPGAKEEEGKRTESRYTAGAVCGQCTGIWLCPLLSRVLSERHWC